MTVQDRIIKFAAYLDVSDVEDRLGKYLPDQDEQVVRQQIEDAKTKSFGLRHPVITGIPTLGIWPEISKEKAIEDMARRYLRRNPEDAERLRAQAREREIYAREVANRNANMATVMGTAGIIGSAFGPNYRSDRAT
jgi:hypothetical protein